MKKKGFLLAETTLKLILAVISIGFLAFLLFSLYNANKTSNELELAKESLNHLFDEINAERSNVEVYNPKGWFISSWSSSGDIPLSCSNLGWQSCVCICDRGLTGKIYGSEIDMCDSAGACLDNTEDFVVEQIVDIKNPPVTLTIDYSSKIISESK